MRACVALCGVSMLFVRIEGFVYAENCSLWVYTAAAWFRKRDCRTLQGLPVLRVCPSHFLTNILVPVVSPV